MKAADRDTLADAGAAAWPGSWSRRLEGDDLARTSDRRSGLKTNRHDLCGTGDGHGTPSEPVTGLLAEAAPARSGASPPTSPPPQAWSMMEVAANDHVCDFEHGDEGAKKKMMPTPSRAQAVGAPRTT